MRFPIAFVSLCVSMHLSCAPASGPVAQPATQKNSKSDVNSLTSLHVRITLNPDDGTVTYLGWYDGRRNLLGAGGIVSALVGMEPPELHGQLKRISDHELRFEGTDQNLILWKKRFEIDDAGVNVVYQITNQRNEAFDAIIFSLADLPDATISGDNRDQYIQSPIAAAHFHAQIANPNFPGEQMSPYAMRTESRHLEPGESMELRMRWELSAARRE
jgi:hypothetical protein